MKPDLTKSQFLYYNDIPAPLGKISAMGIIKDGAGTERGKFRLYDRYALVYLIEGEGEYCDASGLRCDIREGDLISVTPQIPHRYCSRPGTHWTEWHLIFDGPLFDFCRDLSVWNVKEPVRSLKPIDEWLTKLCDIVEKPDSRSTTDKTAEISRLFALISEICSTGAPAAIHDQPPDWLRQARQSLESNLDAQIDLRDLAAKHGVSYETFRKRFRKEFKISPHACRMRRRILAAADLLTLTPMTQQQISSQLGFTDEFHFSKQFKSAMNIAPSAYRKRFSG